MSNRSGVTPGTAAQSREYRGYGGRPMSKPPACKDGEVIRSLERGHGERMDEAIVRAQALGWWAKRTRKQPYATARCWIWLVKL